MRCHTTQYATNKASTTSTRALTSLRHAMPPPGRTACDKAQNGNSSSVVSRLSVPTANSSTNHAVALRK